MKRPSLYKSIALHLAAVLVVMIDLPDFGRHKLEIGQAPIIVDLSQVKISEMTNLPPKAQIGEKTQKATAVKHVEKYTTEERREETPVMEEKAQKLSGDNLIEDAKEPQKKPAAPTKKPVQKPLPPKPSRKPTPPAQPKPKPTPKVKPETPKDKTPPVKATESKTPQPHSTITNPLKSLMDSVDALKAQAGEENRPATIAKDENVANMGIEGGTDGSYFSELSISETDAIASRLRQCWNFDAGTLGIKEMIVEIRAYLNQDGTVRDVKILDTSRYNADSHFRAVAESARRAVYNCQPYSIFAEKYADHYDSWKTMKLRFNPLSGNIN